MTFPSDWPDDCPPPDAIGANGEFYRIVTANPPTAKDFLTYWELGKPRTNRLCDSAGLSLFGDVRDAYHYADKFPSLGSAIAKGALAAEHGKIKPTSRHLGGRRNSHNTWWPYEGVGRHTLFSVVKG